MSQSESKTDFKLILNGVRSDALTDVAQELTTLFPLDKPTAMNIVKNAPIILLDKLTPLQARNVGTYATRLKALGADILITGQPVGKLQALRWPLLPDITKRSGNHVICPNCGARLQIQVHAGPEASDSPAQPAAFPPSQAAAQSMPSSPPAHSATPPSATPHNPQPGPQSAEQQSAFGTKEDAVLEPIIEEVAELSDDVSLSDEKVVLDKTSRPPAPPSPPSPAPVGGGTFRVLIVGKIKGEKKQKASDIMAEYLGISRDEALVDLNRRTVLTVAKDLTEEQAEDCRHRFAEIGVRVNLKG